MNAKDIPATALKKRARQLVLTGAARDYNDALHRAETMLAQEDRARAEVAARDRENDEARWHAVLDHLLEYWPDDPAQGLEAVLIGSIAAKTKVEEAPFWSVKARQLDETRFLLGGLINDLEKTDLFPLWNAGGPEFDRDVARALWQLDTGSEGMDAALPPPALAMAKLIWKFQEFARKEQNSLAGQLEQSPGALVSGSHDPLRLRRAGKAAWIGFILPLLDDRIFETVDDPGDLLGTAWKQLVHGGAEGPAFRFRNADGWTAYNARFGCGTLREAVVTGLEQAARRVGMMQVMGSDPELGLEGIIAALNAETLAIDPETQQRLDVLLAGLAAVRPLGANNPVIEHEAAMAALEDMASLGEALFPEGDDLPAFGTDVPYRGKTLFQTVDADLAALARGTGIASPEQRADFASALALFCESFNAGLAERFGTPDNPPGKATHVLRQMLKLNVTHWWREAMRPAALLALRSLQGRALQRDFAALDPTFAMVLAQYGIDEAGWTALRAGRPAKAVHEALNTYLWDRLAFVAVAADAPDHAMLGRGAADFTAEGELLRFMVQVRDFRAAFVPKPLGNAAAGRESDRAMRRAMAGGDGLGALASLIIWTVLLARLGAFAADVGEDKAPRAGLDDRSWFYTAITGGGLGFCADFLFGEASGLARMPLVGYTPPRHPSIDSALALWQEALQGEDVRAALAAWSEEQTDGQLDVLQVTRQALNYALLHHLQDMMEPGYLPRTVKDMRARAAGAYWRMPGGAAENPLVGEK